ncbi:hypothetical protein ANO11243_012230 [Dothideomycetidae sp. 11243]|nr:hypothetical protein ANO11243_012230 [fungal sp. No.11243]
MAPSKRRRTHDDDDDEGDRYEGEQRHPKSLTQRAVRQTANAKRSRVSLAAENGGSVVSDEEESPESSLDNHDADPDDENVAEDALIQEMRGSRDFKEWLEPEKANQAADYGIIEEIFCQNFMCHEKLRIPLGPLINFIIGHNGSGKSAVLTALTLCLGVKATATNRGASLKKFIKEGSESALLRVKIKNQGELAYQHDMYGDSIFVERTFNRSGTSAFKLQSANCRTISTKRVDLEDMLDYLGLQLDNPLNVLSQDDARQFLSNSTPRDKYKFFLKGTQLEQLDRDYRLMHEYIDQIEANTEQRTEDMEILKRRLQAAEEKKKLMDQAGTIRQRYTEMSWKHAWAQVEEAEREQDQANKGVAQQDIDLKKKEEELRVKSSDYAAKDELVQAVGEVDADLKAQLHELEEKQKQVKEEYEENNGALAENSTQLRHIKTDLNAAKQEVKKQKAAIAEEERRIESATGPAQAQKLTELREAELDAEEKKRQSNSTDKQSLDQAKERADAEVKLAKRALVPAQRASDTAEGQLSSLLRSQGDQMKGFNDNMPKLLKAIQNETRFRQKPVGPLGLHVRLKKPEWSPIVESIFGGVLEAFVVTNPQDQSILRTLQQKCSCPGDIYIGDPRPIDVSQNSAGEDQDTLLRILDIEHDLIRNQFIINQAAEQTVLIKDRRTAHDYMYAATKPKNVKSVLCMHDHIRGEGHRLASSANGQRLDRVRPWTKVPRMKTDVDAQINNQREMVNDARKKLEEQQQIVRQRELQVRKAADDLKRFAQQQRNFRTAYQEAEDRVQDLRAELDSLTVDAGTMSSLREALREAEGTEQLHANSYTDAAEAKDRINDAQREVKRRLDAATDDVRDARMKLKKLEASAAKKESARSEALRAKNQAVLAVENAKEKLTAAEKQKEEKDTLVSNFTAAASEIHPRVPVEKGLTADAIDQQMEALVRERNAAEASIGGTREEIERAYHTAKGEYRTAQTELTSMTRLAKLLKKTYFHRSGRWIEFRRYITARAKVTFALLLNQRAFKGWLVSDHKNRALEISVEPDATVEDGGGRQAKTLSGGEKSFSTICLLLSIWDAMGSAIRCLDEFDVFMDNVNRDRSMRMMVLEQIQAARRATGKQYILITPQAMGNVAVDHDVKIIKMSDPERGQTALPF